MADQLSMHIGNTGTAGMNEPGGEDEMKGAVELQPVPSKTTGLTVQDLATGI